MSDYSQPQEVLDAAASGNPALQGEIEKTISALGEFRASLKVRLGIVDDQLIQFTDLHKQTKSHSQGIVGVASQHTIILKDRLIKWGCDEDWVEISVSQIASELGVSKSGANEFINVLISGHGLQVVNPRHKGQFNLYCFCSDARKSLKIKQLIAKRDLQLNSVTKKLEDWLRENGAIDGWVLCLHSKITKEFSCSDGAIKQAFRTLRNRGLYVSAGKIRYYTYEPGLPDPKVTSRKLSRIAAEERVKERAVDLTEYLLKLGASRLWLSVKYSAIAQALNWHTNEVRPVIDHLVKHHGLRFEVGTKSKPSRFTFYGSVAPAGASEPENTPPEARVEPPKKADNAKRIPAKERVVVKALPVSCAMSERAAGGNIFSAPKPHEVSSKATDGEAGDIKVQDAVLEALHGIKAKLGAASFSIPLKGLARAADQDLVSVRAAMDALAAGDEITITKFNKSSLEYFLKITESA